jgi:hypothetical protein
MENKNNDDVGEKILSETYIKYGKDKKRYCVFCDKNISYYAFSNHNKRKIHLRNVELTKIVGLKNVQLNGKIVIASEIDKIKLKIEQLDSENTDISTIESIKKLLNIN